MDFDDQFRRYFATADLSALSAQALAAGIERMQVELGLEKDRSRRFALWALLHAERGGRGKPRLAFEIAAPRSLKRRR